MPISTDFDPTAEDAVPAREGGGEDDSTTSSKVGDQSGSGYDVLNSAASPHDLVKPDRWDRFVLLNVVIPFALILAGGGIIKLLGVAHAAPLPPPDTSVAAVLESLPATRVEVIRSLQETGQQLELVINGTVAPYQEARVSSEVAGRIVYKSEDCEAGALVREGDTLMRIDSTDYSNEVKRLTKLLSQESLAVEEVVQEIENTMASIKKAEEDVALKQKEVQRKLELGKKNFASAAELDQAKSGLLQAEQQRLSLQNQRSLLDKRKSRLEASKDLAQTQLDIAEVNVARCEIVAPISGVIVSEQADLNTFVNRGTPLITIEDVSKVDVAASMRMDQLHWVLDQKERNENGLALDDESPEQTSTRGSYELPNTDAIIEYEVAGRKDIVHRWNGKLVSYDGIGIDPKTRTVPVRLVVDSPTQYVDEDGTVCQADGANALLRGMFVRVRLRLNPSSDLVVIPARALRPGNRVWKFSPDDSVLDRAVAEAVDKAKEIEARKAEDPSAQNQESKTGDTNDDETEAAGEEEAGEPFIPELWQSGLVRYSKSVYPVDSLRLDDSKREQSDLAPSLQSVGRVWVCEASKSDLAKGDYVVVSPLDSIPPSGLPARAQIKP